MKAQRRDFADVMPKIAACRAEFHAHFQGLTTYQATGRPTPTKQNPRSP